MLSKIIYIVAGLALTSFTSIAIFNSIDGSEDAKIRVLKDELIELKTQRTMYMNKAAELELANQVLSKQIKVNDEKLKSLQHDKKNLEKYYQGRLSDLANANVEQYKSFLDTRYRHTDKSQ